MPSDKLAILFDSAVSWIQHCSGGDTTLISNAFLHLTPLLWNSFFNIWFITNPLHNWVWKGTNSVHTLGNRDWLTVRRERSQTTQRGFLHGGLLQNHCCHNPRCTITCLQTQVPAWPLLQQGCLDHPRAFPRLLDEHGCLPVWVLLFEQVQRRHSAPLDSSNPQH